MAPKIPKYNNWWEELFPSPDMSRNPNVRSGQRKKMVGPVHVNRWGPNKEAWSKIGNAVLGLPSQQEIEMASKLRNNRIKNEDIAKINELTGDTPKTKKSFLQQLSESFDGQEEGSAQINAMFGHKPSDNDNKTALLEKTKSTNNTLNTNSGLQNLPNTKETSTTDPVKIPEVEKGGTRWVGGNSTWVSGRTGDVIAPNIKDLPKEEVASILRNDGNLNTSMQQKTAQNQLNKVTPTNQESNWFQSLFERGSAEKMGLSFNPNSAASGANLSGLNIGNAAQMKNIGDTTASAIASLPKAEQLTKMFDGTKAGFAKGMNTVSAIASALQAVFSKKKKPSTAGMEGKGGNIDQVLVASGSRPESFYEDLV